MYSVPFLGRDRDNESSHPAYVVTKADDTTPLLSENAHGTRTETKPWRPGPGFIWVEIGKELGKSLVVMGLTIPEAIFSNVFLSGFDGTITASTYAVIGSEFQAANTISWLTTSYLITSTAFQPLYGRFSDILGRRTCFFTATLTFMAGCLGCALAPDIITLNLMRALTGLGGGGLMTMATIINSDMIPFQERGMYQATQNVLHGFGSICGASLGGAIADSIGWRWCFLCQVPVSVFALIVGHFVIKKNESKQAIHEENAPATTHTSKWERIDLTGAILLVLGLSAQLAAMSMGGNNYPWSDRRVVIALVFSAFLLIVFVFVEARTRAVPVMPISMLKGTLAISNQISNICVGMAAYSVSLSPLKGRRCINFSQVLVHNSPVFPGGPSRQRVPRWHTLSNSFSSHPCRRAAIWYHYVSLGPSERTCEARLVAHDGW